MHTYTHNPPSRGQKAGPCTRTNLCSWTSSETGNEGICLVRYLELRGFQLLAKHCGSGNSFPWRGATGDRNQKERFCCCLSIYLKTQLQDPSPTLKKNCQQSHLYYIHFNEYFVEVFPYPQAACTDVKCCSSFFGIKNIASYLQFPPEGSKSFHLPPNSCWTFLDLCLCLRREEIMWPKRRKEVCTGYKMPLEARKGKLIKETGKEFGR